MSRWSPSYRIQPQPDHFATALDQIGNSALLVGEAAFDRRRQNIANDEIKSRDKWRQADAERATAEAAERKAAREAQARQQQIQNAGQGIFDASNPGLYTNQEEWTRVPDLITGGYNQGGFQVKGRARRQDVVDLGEGAFYDPTRDQDVMARNRQRDESREEAAARFAHEIEMQNRREAAAREEIRLRGIESRRTRETPLPPRPKGAVGTTPAGADEDEDSWVLKNGHRFIVEGDGMRRSPVEAAQAARDFYRSSRGMTKPLVGEIRPEPSGSLDASMPDSIDPVMWERFQAEKRRGGR
jgi:hypothetical protein